MKKKTKRRLLKIFIGLLILLGYMIYDNYLINHKVNYRKENVNNNSNLYIYYLDVGQANCTLIKENNRYILIDSGNALDRYKLVPYFKELGITKFDYVIGTHAHEDHIGSMATIIKEFDLDKYYMPSRISDIVSYVKAIEELKNKNMFVSVPKDNEEISLDSLKCIFLSNGEGYEDINDTSLVLKCNYFNNSFIFMGDATSNVERNILNKDLKSDVLQVSHHGSRDATSANFLRKVNPSYAIISVGKNNEYGLPKEVTLNKLDYLKVEVHRTDEEGTIILKSDGNIISFTNEKTNTNFEVK